MPSSQSGQALPLDLQLDRLNKQRQIPDAPDHMVVDGGDPLGAAIATSFAPGGGMLGMDQPRDSAADLAPLSIHAISCPATEQRHTIQLGHGRPQFVVQMTTI